MYLPYISVAIHKVFLFVSKYYLVTPRYELFYLLSQ